MEGKSQHNSTRRGIIYTPDDEPYLGRTALHAFDNLIVTCLRSNSHIAPRTYGVKKSDLQEAACQLVPQAFSIALSIRELVRQGYLFGALVLMRSLAERATILLYLQSHPLSIAVWVAGWKHGERPTFAKMLSSIAGDANLGPLLTRTMNSLTHGDPDSGVWNLVKNSDGSLGHAASKIIDRPDLCDKIASEAAAWMAVAVGMAHAIFPEGEENRRDTPAK